MIEMNITACPVCGETRIESVYRCNQHSNGHWNERVTFVCGFEAKFSPNFMKIEMLEKNCSKNPEIIARKKAQVGATKSILKILKKLPKEDGKSLINEIYLDMILDR